VKDRQFLELVPTVVRHALEQLDRERRLAAAEEALKREHAFISAVLDTAGALVVVLDHQGHVVRFNRACEQTTGYRFEEVKGKPFWDLFIVPEELETVKAVFARLAAGHFPSQHENYWRTRAGQLRSITWSNTVLPGPHGAVDYIISTGLDVTDRKRLEREILQISELEQRRIGQDLHDGLCQHLAGIEFMSQGLQQKLASKSKTEAAGAAEITKLVREGIAHTRDLARGLSPVVLESEGLMSALQELADHTAKRFHVQCRFACEVPVLVPDNAVATHLYRITQEAVGNAVKHGRARRIEIHLSAGPDRLTLAVKDNGAGLPEALPRPGGMGLRIMQYRAGMIGAALTIQRLTEGGTVVACAWKRPAEPPANP
ncbi:MAG: PAS domain S-box protein, partial [Verrucomicrobia bacterium]|nr:PAS domain S-box protein [Verrucomicrobiota bacterium]